jgi:hypothetical protein
MSLLMGGGQALQGLGNWLGGGQERKLQGQQMGRQTDMYNLLRYNSGMGQPVINNQLYQHLMNMFKQSMSGQLAGNAAGAAKMGSLSSPDLQKMLAGLTLGPAAQFGGNLMTQNLSMTQNRDNALRQMLLRLAGA